MKNINLKSLWNSHKWFCKESRKFVGIKVYGRVREHYRLKDIFYFPIAYIKFMYYEISDNYD